MEYALHITMNINDEFILKVSLLKHLFTEDYGLAIPRSL